MAAHFFYKQLLNKSVWTLHLFCMFAVLTGILLGGFSTFAADVDPAMSSGIRLCSECELIAKSKVENALENDRFYFYVGGGYVPTPQHDALINTEIGAAKAQGWEGTYAGVLEVPGLYYRCNTASLIGVSLIAVVENYSYSWRTFTSLGYETYAATLSWMKFWGPRPGLGYFVRAKIGPGEIIKSDHQNTHYYLSYFSGVFEQVGFGYGYELFDRARLVFGIDPYYIGARNAHYESGVTITAGLIL